LTEGNIKLKFALDTEGRVNDKVLFYAYLNSTFESGFINPIDDAIRSSKQFDLSAYKKLDEIPYDFVRKRISVLISYKNNENIMITKGAVKNILDICSKAEVTGEKIIELAVLKDSLQKQFEELSLQGLRILGLAYRNDVDISIINKDYERDMIFLGFLVFFDPIKPGIVESIKKLKKLKVSLKIISGDNLYVTSHLGKQIGLISKSEILTGSEISHMTPESLTRKVRKVNIFAEIEPAQKEQIILALRKSGNIVGYLGDGVNDAAAIHSADVGISVDKSTDVLKETADIVLLEKDISVLIDGIMEGRRTFANTMKYVFMATSANFGNMFSMAGVSLFLTFLPLLPKQILLTNLMTDFPEMTISTDNVDKEILEVPRHWDLKFIRKFMLVFGFLSTLFDFLTFIVLLNILQANIEQFRTTWFMESVISASLVVLIIRSKKPLMKSTPGKFLLITTLIVNIFVLAIPLTPVGPIFGFVVIPLTFYLSIGIIVLAYVLMAEVTKWLFYRLVKM
jgi:Mg2+-importing ATPase